ncbi:hypothetical protein E4T50_06003 [Aureobasidium sp. EXF-12298]|nr:hypothetical protein E4T50_06003 [Aureobasidium sp. EXF-12298]
MDSSSTIMGSDYDETMSQTSDALSNADDGNISIIDYARYYGLTKDYTSFYPLSPHILHSIPVWEHLDPNIDQLPQFKLPDGVDLDEKWTIDHQSAVLLKQIASLEVVPSPEITRQRDCSAEYKIEPLLLPTDPELDHRRFVRARNSRQAKGSQKVSSEALWQDDERAPLHWPESDLPVTLIEEIKKERLQLDRNDIIFLQQCISTPEKPDLQDLDVLPHKKAGSYVRVFVSETQEYEEARHTSPLLPCSSPFQFGVPDSPVSRIPLATSPIDPVPAEIARIEGSMDLYEDFALDGLSDISVLDIEAASETHFSPPLKRKRPEDYKIELPLSPALQSSSPTKKFKMVTFSDELCTTIPEYAKPFSSDDSNGTDGISDFFERVIKPGAQSALLAINGEQLTQANSVLRVDVPVVNQTSPLPPWEVFAHKQLSCQTELEAQQQLISMLKREFIKPCEKWPNVGKVDSSMSRWRPFDMRQSDLLGEDIDCDYLDEFGPEEPQDTTSGWKLDGLRVLDPCEDDDEEIEPANMPKMLDNLSLTYDGPEVIASSIAGNSKLAATLQTRPFLSFMPKTNASQLSGLPSHEGLAATQSLVSTFSASNSLDRFMQVQTGKEISTEKQKRQTQTVPKNEDKPTDKLVAHPGKENDMEKATGPAAMHLPSLPSPMPPRTFVLSSTMFVRRSLIKEISHLSSMAEYIERDFTSARVLRGMSSPASGVEEADIILAPGHGLMLITLQRLMQKSLPGQVVRNVIRERIIQLARRYERLIVMVHEDGSSSRQRPLDNRDSSELASLINFCAALSHDIQVMYIPGDESALATWIVASMVRFGLDDPELQLAQDESSWELFLRKAGMDVFAAQFILIKLKAPDPVPASSTTQYYGLPAFVMMNEAERIRKFSTYFGGEKILRKVSMAIDGSWTRDVVAGDLNGRKL